MSRLFDRLRRSYPDFIDTWDACMVIDGTNVTRYTCDNRVSQGVDLYTDYPNLAPPFQIFFIESRVPERLKIGDKYQPWTIPIQTWGNLFLVSDIEQFTEYLQKHGHKFDINPDTKWVISTVTICEADNVIYQPAILFSFCIAADGSVLPVKKGSNDKNDLAWIATILRDNGKYGEHTELYKNTSLLTLLSLATIPFLHCKNVEMVPNKPEQRTQHRAVKRYGQPLCTYHTLKIRPMQRILETEGRLSETGIRQALHICRGHFKDFRNGTGLFGKFKGLYWWDQQLRGAPEFGVVDKDYEVAPVQSKEIT
jgi:hypothetical protein